MNFATIEAASLISIANAHVESTFKSDGFTIQVQQISQIEKTHSLSPCKMESPQDQLQGELDYESVHPSYLKRP